MYDILVIGAGITGLLVVASLQKNGLTNIGIIDPYFNGGDLIHKYGLVNSNTPLQKTVNGLKLIDPNYEPPSDYDLTFDKTKTAPLYIHTQLIQDFVKLHKIDCIQDKVKQIQFTESIWNIETLESNYKAKIVILCQGSNAKKLNCGIPIIPLEEALYKDSLKKYLKPTDKVLVFGTAHSGSLVLQNCEDLQVQTTAIYRKEKPFYFANEGDYDGIKEDAEFIARRILNNEFRYVNLVSSQSIEKLIKASKEATKVIYAIGFESRKLITLFNNETLDSTKYDSRTGRIADGLWGFGIAYPSLAPDEIHVDVGVISFAEHILKQIPDMKEYLSKNR